MMNEKEFEEYKQSVAGARKNRLYVSWRNISGVDCKSIGPSSSCFCGHRYKHHNFDNVKSKKVNCRENCKCKMFDYVPIFGSQDLKCRCKHSYTDHGPNTKKCRKCDCMPTFTTSYACACGMTLHDHQTVFETRQERM